MGLAVVQYGNAVEQYESGSGAIWECSGTI